MSIQDLGGRLALLALMLPNREAVDERATSPWHCTVGLLPSGWESLIGDLSRETSTTDWISAELHLLPSCHPDPHGGRSAPSGARAYLSPKSSQQGKQSGREP